MAKLSKDYLIVLGVVVAMIAIAAALVYVPQGRKIETLRASIGGLDRCLQADRQRAELVPGLARQVEEMKGRYRDFGRKLPYSKELGEFLAEITRNLDDGQLAEAEIKPGSPSAEELYNILPIKVRCRGSYLSLAGFLKRISEMRRLTRVHTLKMNRVPADERLDIEMQLNIYFRKAH